MYLLAGGHRHDDNECTISIARDIRRTREEVPISRVERWTIQGRLQAGTQAEVTAKILALQAAYVDGIDFALKFDDDTPSAHELLSTGSLGGTRIIKPPEFPVGAGAEYTTFRNYTAVVEAEYLDTNTSLLSWVETLDFQNAGGPIFTFLPVINGLPPKQMAMQATTFRATQSGEAVGLLGYPLPPPPLWPADEHSHLRRISRSTPRRIGRPPYASYLEYPVRWNYVFESPVPMIGMPNGWPT